MYKLTESEFKNRIKEHMRKVISEMMALHFNFNVLRMDHVCIRTETDNQYIHMKSYLCGLGKILSHDAFIAGRRITTFGLKSAIRLQLKTYPFHLSTIELCEPKAGSVYAAGLEHIEFTLQEPCTFQTFIKHHKCVDFDTSAINSTHHPSVRFYLPESQVYVKINNQSLRAKIQEEERDLKKQQRKNRKNHFA